jgi:4-carboxymuconolactone decarboxylase
VAGDWPKGNPNSGYAQYFIGNSHLAGLHPVNLGADEQGVLNFANVTFEPGCRNNWHIHHGARQILICVSGRGWYQEWGKPAIPLKAGDIVDIPEGVKHWHGAQANSWFQHLAVHVEAENTQPGSVPNEWLEPVNDEHYNKLSAK